MSTTHKSAIFVSTWTFLILVSVIDGYLLLENRDVIAYVERNPLGLMLIAINGGRVWLFLALKLLGTVLASAVLILIYQRNARLGMIVSLSVACFQLGLLLFLYYG